MPLNSSVEALSSHTLPSHYYLGPGILEHEKTAIFYRHWYYAGYASQFTSPGDFPDKVRINQAGEW